MQQAQARQPVSILLGGSSNDTASASLSGLCSRAYAPNRRPCLSQLYRAGLLEPVSIAVVFSVVSNPCQARTLSIHAITAVAQTCCRSMPGPPVDCSLSCLSKRARPTQHLIQRFLHQTDGATVHNTVHNFPSFPPGHRNQSQSPQTDTVVDEMYNVTVSR